MTWCVLASKKKRECIFVICQCDKLCVCWAVEQPSTFRPSNVAPIILTNSVWYVRKTQKYIFFNVEETMKSVPFSLKKIGGILNQMEYYLKVIESENSVESSFNIGSKIPSVFKTKQNESITKQKWKEMQGPQNRGTI